jgi:hypothetical protein
LIRALAKFGSPLTELSPTDFLAPNMIIQLGVEPCRIDLLTGIDGIEFDDAWRNKVSITLDELEINILSKEDLLRNKLAAGRDKDQSDILWLEKNRSDV